MGSKSDDRKSAAASMTNDDAPRSLSQRRQLSQVIGDAVKRYYVLVLAVAAITSSVLVIFSCKFFSYTEIEEVVDNGFEEDVINSSNNNEPAEPVISFEPFEYLSEAGVGLFKYYMGDPSGKGVMMRDAMCFSYCDEYTDYQWLSSNNKETGHGNVDIWLVARFCSILAPIVGFLALIQLLLELICGYRLLTRGKFIKTILFFIAAFLQFGTFAVMFASPIMNSTSSKDQQQQFCFSAAATSTVECRIDTGAMFSLGSAIVYVILAFSSICVCRTTNTTAEHDTESEDNSDSNSNEKEKETTTDIINDNNVKDDISDSSVSC